MYYFMRLVTLKSMSTSLSCVHKIRTYIDTHHLIPPKTHVLLGLSGGPDSLFLMHFLAHMHNEGLLTLTAAHLDHEWRTDSYRDVEFCQQTCRDLGINLVVARASDLGSSFKFNGSKEEMGRRLRRHFFETTAEQLGAQRIALAHHADDQCETFFIRLMRGTSLTGLTGMRPHTGMYIRPLLGIHKHEILTYLHEQNISYLTDPTNMHDLFLRNRIRTQVIPALQQTDARFEQTFARTLDHLQTTENFIERCADEAFTATCTHDDSGYHLATQPFSLLDPIMQHRVLLRWLCAHHVSFPPHDGFFKELLNFVVSDRGGTHRLHHAWAVVKKQHYARIVRTIESR